MSGDSADAGFAAVADDLYAVPAAGFVAERNARAKAARADGDRDLGARIAALPKPSASAWLVNLLVREGADDLDRVLDLGDALRSAQQEADRDRLRGLGGERRALLSEVSGRAAHLAEQAGHVASAAALEELQQTVQAALADESAAEAIRSGRLVRALQADGLGAVDLADAIAGPGGHRSARPTRPARSASRGDGDGRTAQQEDADRRAAEDARRAADIERRVEEAERRAQRAAEVARDADALVGERDQEAEASRRRVDELRAQLDSAQAQLEQATKAVADARSAAEDAAGARTEAEQEADRARAAR